MLREVLTSRKLTSLKKFDFIEQCVFRTQVDFVKYPEPPYWDPVHYSLLNPSPPVYLHFILCTQIYEQRLISLQICASNSDVNTEDESDCS